MTPAFESKFTFRAEHGLSILAWIEHIAAADPAHPANRVFTAYFDTPGMHLYDQKRQSEYLKAKLRLRWYGLPDGSLPGDTASCFLEAKRRTGSTRAKQRSEHRLPAADLVRDPLGTAAGLVPDCAELLPDLAGPPIPMLLIQYLRRRFVDPLTGARLALDTDIRCTHINSDHVIGTVPVALHQGVLEVKGGERDALPPLDPILPLIARESFSKYARCYDAVTCRDTALAQSRGV